MEDLRLEGVFIVPEIWWSESGVHPDRDELIQGDINELFGDSCARELNSVGIGLGASVEAILFYVLLPFNLVGGTAGLFYLAEKFKELRERWKKRTGSTVLYQKNIALAVSISDELEGQEVKDIRFIKCFEQKFGPEDATLGDCPILYIFLIGVFKEDRREDILHILVTREDGSTLLHNTIVEPFLFFHMYDEQALEHFIFEVDQ